MSHHGWGRALAKLTLLALLLAACAGDATAPPPPIVVVTIEPDSVEVVVLGTAQLTATMWDAAGRAVGGRTMTWASSDPAVGSVSSTGLVTALIRGSTTITVTCEGWSATAVVIVFLPMGV